MLSTDVALLRCSGPRRRCRVSSLLPLLRDAKLQAQVQERGAADLGIESWCCKAASSAASCSSLRPRYMSAGTIQHVSRAGFWLRTPGCMQGSRMVVPCHWGRTCHVCVIVQDPLQLLHHSSLIIHQSSSSPARCGSWVGLSGVLCWFASWETVPHRLDLPHADLELVHVGLHVAHRLQIPPVDLGSSVSASTARSCCRVPNSNGNSQASMEPPHLMIKTFEDSLGQRLCSSQGGGCAPGGRQPPSRCLRTPCSGSSSRWTARTPAPGAQRAGTDPGAS